MQPNPADAGDMVVGWLTKVAVALLLVGLVGFELLSLVVARIQLGDAGASAGSTALTAYAGSHSLSTAYNQAEVVAEQAGANIVQRSFRINADGSVEFTIRKTANTLVLQHIKATEPWTRVHTHVVLEPNSFSQ